MESVGIEPTASGLQDRTPPQRTPRGPWSERLESNQSTPAPHAGRPPRAFAQMVDPSGNAPDHHDCQPRWSPSTRALGGAAGYRPRLTRMRSASAAFCTTPVSSSARNRTLSCEFGVRLATMASELFRSPRLCRGVLPHSRESVDTGCTWQIQFLATTAVGAA